MKIVFLVAHMGSGGSERTVAYLSDYFVKNKIDTYILNLSSDIFYSIAEGVKIKNLNISSAYINVFQKFENIAKRYLCVKRWISENKPDVIICLLPEMAKYVFRLKSKYHFKLVTSERNNPAIVTDKKTIQLKERVYSKSDLIIFQTERAKAFYGKSIQEKGIVICNAVGNELAYQIKHDPTHTTKSITAVGRLVPQKDYPTLIRAFKLLLEKHKDYTLDIYGTGDCLKQLEVMTEELGIKDSVSFKGENKMALEEVAKSTCYVLSSLYEGMPNSLMEAMAIGMPCVSTDCPNGPSELIQNGENGLLVKIGDYEGLSSAIITMIEDADFAKECGKKASMILETNSIEQIASLYLKSINGLYEKEELACNQDLL